MMRVTVAEWLLTLLGIATLTGLTMGTELHHATVCYRNSFSHPLRCREGTNIYVESVSFETRDTCPEESSCGHPAVNRTLYDVIRSQCDGATACLTNTTEAFWDSVICPPRNWVDVLYTCWTLTPNESTSDAPTTSAQSVAPSVAGDRRAMDGDFSSDVLIASTTTVACLIILTIFLVVVCVRRRRRGQKPPPSTGFTGHRDTATEDVYTVNDDDNYDIVQSPMATYHPELTARRTPHIYLELSAPGPGSSSRDPETSHREPERTPEALDGGAAGGEESHLEIHGVVHNHRQDGTELCLKDNKLYGQLT